MSDIPEMVKRVAAAMTGIPGWIPPGLTESEWRMLARAAIAAMRVPTEAMLAAGNFVYPNEHGGLYQRSTREQWQEMIDAALTGCPCPSASEARPPTSEP